MALRQPLEFPLALLAAGTLIVGAFALIFCLGWAAVHLVGPPLFALLPRPLALLATALATALIVYGTLASLPKLARSTWNKLGLP